MFQVNADTMPMFNTAQIATAKENYLEYLTEKTRKVESRYFKVYR